MGAINRREWCVGASSALAAFLTQRVRAATAADIPPAPVARVAVVKDTYFGETLSDPYRWMENDKDPEWLPFLKGQNAHARAVLDRVPGREAAVQAYPAAVSGDAALTRRAQRAGGRLFFEQRPVGADNYKLFVRERGVDRVLIDPTLLSDGSGHQSLDWWRAFTERLARGLRPVEGRQRGLGPARAERRRWPRPARAHPRHRERHPSGWMTAAGFSTTSSPARSTHPSATWTARRAFTCWAPSRRLIRS